MRKRFWIVLALLPLLASCNDEPHIVRLLPDCTSLDTSTQAGLMDQRICMKLAAMEEKLRQEEMAELYRRNPRLKRVSDCILFSGPVKRDCSQVQ